VPHVSVREFRAMCCLRFRVTRPCDIGMTGMVCRGDASSNCHQRYVDVSLVYGTPVLQSPFGGATTESD
jgi:hypothetical protein